MPREYKVAPPFEKPKFSEGPQCSRDWTASKYVPSDSLNARMSRAWRRASERAAKRGDLAKAAQKLRSAEILDKE